MFIFKVVFLVLTIVVAVVNSLPHGIPPSRIHRRAPACKPDRPSRSSAVPPVASSSPARLVAASSAPAAAPSPSASKPAAKPKDEDEAPPPPPKSSDSKSNDQPPVSGSLMASLFPLSSKGKSWTTSSASGNALPLSDGTLRPTRVLKALPHDYVTGPEGKKAIKAHYAQGSYTFGHSPQGGFSFYAPGPASVDLKTAREATFGYSVYFPKGFQFQLGGILPGLYGGDSDDEAVGCSGGRRSDKCFSARLMWRSKGAGEFYTYLPPFTDNRFSANKKQCKVAPYSECNPTYGNSIGRGSFTFPTGQWTTISERVKLNDVGQANGELELFVNGESVINVSGLILRARDAGRFRGIQMQTFFGGSSTEFASPKAQDVYFADFSMAITKTF